MSTITSRRRFCAVIALCGLGTLGVFRSHKNRVATISWEPNTEPDIAGYRIYYGTAPGNYSTKIDVGNKTTALLNLKDQLGYYFAVTAYNSSGVESNYSAEAVL